MCGAIDSLQLTAKHNVATSVNWKGGVDGIVAGWAASRGQFQGATAKLRPFALQSRQDRPN